MLSNSRRNLTIRHPVHGFNAYDPSTKPVFLKTLLEFALCLTRTEYQNRFCITNARNHRVVVNVEMSRKSSLAPIIWRYVVCFMRTLKRRITRTAGMFLNL